MLEDSFELVHKEGKLFASITINGQSYEMEVTEHFEKHNAYDEWLDYHLGLKEDTEEDSYLKTPIEDLDLSVRVYTALKRYGINTLGDIATKTYDELYRIRNMGKKSLTELMDKLYEYKITLEGKEG
jgi:DNA-directed RNA polymerase alpha subunit